MWDSEAAREGAAPRAGMVLPLAALFTLGLGAFTLAALPQTTPGYMDAEYYLAGGMRLAQGYGFSEPFLWNYLDDPAGLPHPSHAYWMPLASLLAALGMWLSGEVTFTAGRLGFVLLAAAVPPLTALLASRLSARRGAALLAGSLALLPAFYLPYLPTSDTFGIYMLLGALWLLAAGRPSFALQPVLLGLLAGLMHLARADGLLWLALLPLAGWLLEGERRSGGPACGTAAAVLRFSALGLAGYLLVMGPWMLRNLAAFGVPLAPGGGRTLWLTAYDQLYAYPAGSLNLQTWLAAGPAAVLQPRLEAAGLNLQTALSVQGEIFLAPLVLAGLWRLRRQRPVILGAAAWLLTFAAMTLAFPFAGGRGGFFHSGAALQPLFWAVVPAGLDAFLEWGRRHRSWEPERSRPVFGALIAAAAAVLTLALYYGRVIGKPGEPLWNQAAARYAQIEQTLAAQGAAPDDRVLVNNPPGYYLVSGRPALVIPSGDLDTLLAAADRYGARYLALEIDQIHGASELFENPRDHGRLDYLGTAAGAVLYEILPGGE